MEAYYEGVKNGTHTLSQPCSIAHTRRMRLASATTKSLALPVSAPRTRPSARIRVHQRQTISVAVSSALVMGEPMKQVKMLVVADPSTPELEVLKKLPSTVEVVQVTELVCAGCMHGGVRGFCMSHTQRHTLSVRENASRNVPCVT